MASPMMRDRGFSYRTSVSSVPSTPPAKHKPMISIPSLSTIQSMGHLESTISGSMDNNDGSILSTSNKNLEIGKKGKQLSVIITSPNNTQTPNSNTPLASISPDLIIESDSEDDMHGGLVVLDQSGNNKIQKVQKAQPPMRISKSAEIENYSGRKPTPVGMMVSPPVLRQKTYSSTPALPTVVSSGDDEGTTPLSDGTSMISMPLYTERYVFYITFGHLDLFFMGLMDI